MNCRSNMQMCGKKCPVHFCSHQSGPLSQFSKWELPHAPHFLLRIQDTPAGRVCTSKISDQVLATNGKTIKRTQCGSAVLGGSLRSTWGSAVHPTTYQRKRGQVHCKFQFEAQICRCKCKLIWGIKSKKPHIICLTASSPSVW